MSASTVRDSDNAAARLSRAVFLDRDGVLIEDVDHLTSADQIEILPCVPEALARLRAAGWKLVIATNQSVVARGWITEAGLREIHRVLLDRLRARGAEIDAVYYCPHHPDGAVAAFRGVCECRKPNPGMLFQAAHNHHLDLAASIVIGDALTDVEAGHRAGCRTVLLGGAGERGGCVSPDYVAHDLEGAADWILTRA